MRQLMVTPTFVFSVTIVTMAVLAFGTTQTYLRFGAAGPPQGCVATGCVAPGISQGAAGGHSAQAGAVPDGTARAQLPSSAPRPGQPAGAAHSATPVKVSYQTLHVRPWGFTAMISITSRSAQPVSQWQLSLRDRGVRIFWILGASWQAGRDGVLTFRPDQMAAPLRHGETLHVFFIATGRPGRLAGCVFDGLSCKVTLITGAVPDVPFPLAG